MPSFPLLDRLFRPLKQGVEGLGVLAGWRDPGLPLPPPVITRVTPVLDSLRAGGRLRYFLLEIEGVDPVTGLGADNRPWFRAVYPTVLEYLPRVMREQTTVLQRTARMLKGLYNADIHLLCMVAGMFGELGERPLGLVQVYAAQGSGRTAEEAALLGNEAFVALSANLGTIPQARFAQMGEEERDFIISALARFEHAFAAIGQPDPREQGTRAIGERAPGRGPEEETLEQNELIFRGLQRAGIDFACLTMAWGIPREQIYRLQQAFRERATLWLSRVQGQKGIAVNFAIPTVFSGLDTRGQTTSHTSGRTHTETTGEAHTEGVSTSEAHTHGTSHTTGTTETDTTSHARTVGESWGSSSSSGGARTITDGTSHSEGTAHTDGTAHQVSRSTTTGGTTSVSHTTGRTVTDSVTRIDTSTLGDAHTRSSSTSDAFSRSTHQETGQTSGQSQSSSWGHSESRGHSDSWDTSLTVHKGGGFTVGPPGFAARYGEDISGTVGRSGTDSVSHTNQVGGSDTISRATTHSEGSSVGSTTTIQAGTADTASSARTTGTNVQHSESVIVDQQTVTSSTMRSTTQGVADTVSQADTRSVEEGVSRSVAAASSWASASSHENSVSEMEGTSRSVARTNLRTESESVTQSEERSSSDTTSRARSEGETVMSGVSSAVSTAQGVSAGIVGGVSLHKTYQWWDATAEVVANLCQRQLNLLDEMMLTGGFMTQSFWLFPRAESLRAAAGLFALAFHGQTDSVVTPARALVLSGHELSEVRPWLMAFLPAPHAERALGVFEGLRYGNLLPMLHLAALISPAVFEGGRATTTKEAIPPYAVYGPALLGIPKEETGVSLGNFISYETGEELPVPYLLSRERMGHFGIFGDSGYGKSEAAMYLLSEMNTRWNLPAVVFDWGLNYRKLLRVIPRGRFFFRSLYPDGPLPVRWNPLQFVADVDPDTQMAMTVDVICNAGGLGERQKGFLRDTLRELYLDAGALTFDPEQQEPVPPPPGARGRTVEELFQQRMDLSRLSPEEVQRLQAEGYSLPPPDELGRIPLRDCSGEVLQKVAVWRSAKVDFAGWYRRLQRLLLEKEARRQVRDIEALQGILNRLGSLAHGRLARMYAAIRPGEQSLDVTRICFPDRVAIFEGGTMGETEKAILFGLMIAQIYEAAGVRYRRRLGSGKGAENFILAIEEANKVVVSPARQQEGQIATTSQLFSSLARDSRQRGIYLMWLGQSPSAFPPEIVSCCMNFMIFRLKIGDDRELLVEVMAKVSSGLVSPEYLMHISRLPVAQAVVVLGRTMDEVLVEPSLVRTLMVAGEAPGDDELEALGK